MASKIGYVDGFITPVPKKNLAKYRRFSKLMAKIWKEYGAVAYYECVANDVKKGKFTSFPRSVKMKGSETVFFSWIGYKSKGHRAQVWNKVMKDKRWQNPMMDPDSWPFDGMRMIYGGFKPMVSFS